MLLLYLYLYLAVAIQDYSFNSITNTDNCTELHTLLNLINESNNTLIVRITLNATFCDSRDQIYRTWIVGTCNNNTSYTNNYNMINCSSTDPREFTFVCETKDNSIWNCVATFDNYSFWNIGPLYIDTNMTNVPITNVTTVTTSPSTASLINYSYLLLFILVTFI